MTVAEKLLPLITTPYLPLLGPVHPDVISLELLVAILSAEPEEILPYDKDQRWYATKQERILGSDILVGEAGVVIPLINQAETRLRLLCYGTTPRENLQKLQNQLRADFPDASLVVVEFTKYLPPGAHGSTLYLQAFDELSSLAVPEAIEQITRETASDLAALASDPENAGFGFLAEAYADHDLGPTLAIRAEGRVVAAIGPLDTLLDARGTHYLLPPYFGVAASARQQGYGSQLWQGLTATASERGAQYLLVQAEAGQPSDTFYRRQGLISLGAIITKTS